MTKYGRTWWGEQWLRALERVDFSNRLPRGKRYANSGSVISIKINGNAIEAKVQGSRPKPYTVNIIVPPFFEKEQKVILQKIQENPLLISRLLNRELPPELLQIAEQNRIKIFPHSWQDLKLNCNCPDWAVPCKHIAAVIYMVANEIDQNPFLVFKLHHFDILEELSKQKIELGGMEKEKIFSFNDCVKLKTKEKITEKQLTLKEIPDFSTIENLLQTLPSVFSANTLFYSGNFKSVIQNIYKRAAKQENEQLQFRKKSEQTVNNDLRYQTFRIVFSPLAPPSIEVISENEQTLNLSDFLLLLSKTESKHLENYSDSFVALYRIFRFCNILTERGAILPRLMHCHAEKYKILWQPALINDSVKNIFSQLLVWLTDDLVLIKNLQPVKTPHSKNHQQNEKIYNTKKEEALLLLCSLFINHSIKNVFRQHRTPSANLADKKILELFFNDAIVNFSAFNEKEIPNTIQLWLKRFFISEKNFTPLISVTEIDETFEVEVLVQRNDDKLHQKEKLYSFLQNNSDENKMQLLKDLNLLSEYFPDLNKIIETEGKEKLVYKRQSFSEMLLKILPALNIFGIKALLPKSLQQLLRPQVSLKLTSKTKNISYFSLDGLIDYDWQIAVGDTLMSRSEFEQLTKNTWGLVKVREQYMLVDEEEVKKIIRKLEQPVAPSNMQLLQASLSQEYEDAPVWIDETLKKQIKNLLKEETVPIPNGLKAELRSYQQRGFNWLYKNAKLGLGSLLADDMGLGKTLQVITTILKLKENGALNEGPILVVVPTSLLTNWLNEIQKFAPSLRAHVYHGTSRSLPKSDTDIILTTYGVVRSDKEKFLKKNFYAIIIDEAQNIKNSEVAQTKAVKSIPSKIRIALSGTPVENRLSEYWSILDFANPNYLGSVNWFNTEYARPIEINQDRKKLDKFKLITSPFIMRRAKTDKNVISDLPEKIENNQYCNLTKEQAALYQNITRDLMLQIENTDGMSRRGLVLKLLLTLKQICNHPAQYLKNNSYSPELSGKSLLLLQLLETIYENNEKVLIFSQYREMGDILCAMLNEHCGKKPLQLHGGCSRKERDEMVQAFQHSKQYDTFVLSIKAGGTGLNLTAAANVIHYDLWWNPAVEAQATDRAFRIGQKQNVMVHRLLTKGTLEEKIDDMLKSKKQLANLTVANGEKWIGELSDKELKELVTLGG